MVYRLVFVIATTMYDVKRVKSQTTKKPEKEVKCEIVETKELPEFVSSSSRLGPKHLTIAAPSKETDCLYSNPIHI